MTWEPLLEFIRAGEDDDRFNIGGRKVDGRDGGASNSDAMTGAGEEERRKTREEDRSQSALLATTHAGERRKLIGKLVRVVAFLFAN
ncbi:hypothetical protein Bca4012_023761 [Brassica carinata]